MDMDWIRTAKDCEIDNEVGVASDDDVNGEKSPRETHGKVILEAGDWFFGTAYCFPLSVHSSSRELSGLGDGE